MDLRAAVCALASLLAPPLAAGPADSGLPPSRVYSAREYKSHYQVWQPAQAGDGRLYFGSFGGVLEYDGRTWRRISVPTSFVRAVAEGRDGTIYVAGDQCFGRLVREPGGQLFFESLAPHLPEAFRPLTRARTMAATANGLFVATHDAVIRWEHGQASVHPWAGGNKLFALGPAAVNHRQGEGLYLWSGDRRGGAGHAAARVAIGPGSLFLQPDTRPEFVAIRWYPVDRRRRDPGSRRRSLRLRGVAERRLLVPAGDRRGVPRPARRRRGSLAAGHRPSLHRGRRPAGGTGGCHSLVTTRRGPLRHGQGHLSVRQRPAQILLKDRSLQVTTREKVQVVATSGEHLLRMINEVLDFSKIEAGKLELRPAPFHLPSLLREIESGLLPRARAKQLDLTTIVTPGTPGTLRGDAQKLRQVLENLLGNAIKFTPRGHAALEVNAEAVSSGRIRLHCQVRDTGVGLSGSDLQQLFVPFQQAADGRPPEPGTGLGLAISRRLVNLMGGDISVSSERGIGSTFSFSVPVDVLSPAQPVLIEAEPAIIGYHGERRRVLIVDDVATNRQLLVDLLSPVGFIIEVVNSGEEALARIAVSPPDLVVLDLRLQDVDGLEVTRRLRQRHGAQLKVLLTSASVLAFEPSTAFAAGCDDFLPKPFREQDLLRRIQRLLGLQWEREEPPTGEARLVELPAPALAPSGEWLEELRACARRGDHRGLRLRLERARREHPEQAARLAEIDSLLVTYQMDRIRQYLDSLPASPA